MSTARDFLAAVQQRADAATDGPWFGSGGGLHVYGREVGDLVGEFQRERDATFAKHSRTDVPALVAALGAVLDGEAEFIPTPPGPQRAVRDTDLRNAGIAEGWRQARAAITAALTPKENDS